MWKKEFSNRWDCWPWPKSRPKFKTAYKQQRQTSQKFSKSNASLQGRLPFRWRIRNLSFSLKVSDRSFHKAMIHLVSRVWNTPFISSSTSLWYRFLYFRLTYSFTYHFFLFWFTTLLIITPSFFHFRLKTYLFYKFFPLVSLFPPRLSSQIIAWTVSSELFDFCF